MATTKKSSGKPGKKALLSPDDRVAALQTLEEQTQQALEERLTASLQLLETAVGGRDRLVDALIISKHPTAKKFIGMLGKADWAQKPLYNILKANKTNPDELINIFMEGELVASTVKTIVKLSDGLPGVMDTAIESATVPGPEGFQDRKLLFEIAGMHKQEKKGGLNINLNQIQFGSEGMFEKVITRQHGGLHENPFEVDVDAEEVDDDVPS